METAISISISLRPNNSILLKCSFVLTLVIIEVPFPITEKLTDCCFVIALRLNCSGFLFVIDRGSLDHNLKANSTIKIII